MSHDHDSADLTRDCSVSQLESAQDTSQLVSCFWCQRLHDGRFPLSVCTECEASSFPLRSLEMRGTYALSDGAIDEALTRGSPGNYALGYMDGDSFSVFYVGRSDSDVRARLHEWVGMPSQSERYGSLAKASWAVHGRGQLPLDIPQLGRVGNVDTSYTHFAFSYSDSPAAAFEKERRNFEDFGGFETLDNQFEPVAAAA